LHWAEPLQERRPRISIRTWQACSNQERCPAKEIAEIVALLASDRAIVGSVVMAGGMSMLIDRPTRSELQISSALPSPRQ
jgi:hypothetical protein